MFWKVFLVVFAFMFLYPMIFGVWSGFMLRNSHIQQQLRIKKIVASLPPRVFHAEY